MTVRAHAGIDYPTADTAFLAKIADWICAGGNNSSTDVAETFAAKSDEALADEFLSERGSGDQTLDRDDVVAAFARLRAMDDASDAI